MSASKEISASEKSAESAAIVAVYELKTPFTFVIIM
jgi:hypothetical protein